MFWFLVIVVVIIIVVKKNGNTNQNSYSPAGSTSPNNVLRISYVVNSPQDYCSILNKLQDITYMTFMRNYTDISVVVIVRKIDSMYCSIGFSMLADSVFNNVAVGEGFTFSGNDHIKFETNLATGFTNPDDVKREISLQFNWSEISASDVKWTVLSHGDYSNSPLVSYNFTIKKRIGNL